MPIPLQQHLPIQEIDDNLLISRRGDATAVFELTKPELFSLSADELDRQHASWLKAIDILPDGTTLHIQDWYTPASFHARIDWQQPYCYLSRQSDYHFHERPYRQHRCFCSLTRRFGSKRPPTSAVSSLLDRTLTPPGLLNTGQQLEFQNQCRRFMYLLTEGSSIRFRQLTGEELAGTPETRGLLEQYLQLEPMEGHARTSDINLHKGIRAGQKEVLLYTLADAEHLPAQCSPSTRYDRLSTDRTPFPIGFATALGPLLEADHIVSQYLRIDDPAPTLKKMQTAQRRLMSLGGPGGENALTLESINHYLDAAAKGEWKPVKAHFNILAWTDDPANLPAVENAVVAAIGKLGATAHRETIGAPQIWWAGLPGNAGDLPGNEAFDTFAPQAACFFIPESSGRNSKSPFGMRLADRATGIPLHVDISDEAMALGRVTNLNKFILGGSGSGKSFFTNHLVRSYHDGGAHIVIVDIGGSYQGICEVLGGCYFAYNEDRPIQFNPFRLAPGEVLGTEKKESLKALLLTLWKKGDQPFVRSEYIAISNMLEGYYEQLGFMDDFPCFDDFYEWLEGVHVPILEIDGVREKDFDYTNLLYVLRPYYKGGEFDYLLNSRVETNLLQERLIVFELDAIKDHPILFPIVTIVIMEVFISKMRQLEGIRKVILLEEAWKAIAKEGMNEYVKYLFKTVRKFFGEAIVVTQDIEDIVSSPVVKNTIINNADCKILLDQSKFMNRFDQIQELLGLTEKDKTMVLSLNKANDPDLRYKEVFISLGAGHSRVYRVEVSLEEYLVYTTNQREKMKVKDYAKRYGQLTRGVSMLAADIRSGAVKLLMLVGLTALFLLAPTTHASAQIIDLIDEAVKYALEEADLAIQQAQTQALYLQNTEKALENQMTGGLLGDIGDWVQDEEDLYRGYYQELWQVKAAFTSYSRVVQLIQRQEQLVRDYQQAVSAVQRDPHFSPAEVTLMLHVYSGILNASIRNVSQLVTVVNSFVAQMDDAGRLRIIDETAAAVDRNYADLHGYSQENSLLSLQRARDEGDIQTVKALYGLP
jgi:conjugation system TraG family ATPase